MKATGEVMAIAPSFEMALLMKAVRGAEIGMDTLNRKPGPRRRRPPSGSVSSRVGRSPALHRVRGHQIRCHLEEIHEITRIDLWFLCKIKKLADFEAALADGLTEEQYRERQAHGLSRRSAPRLSGGGELPEHRDAVYKMVDTCGAEFDAETPYFYSTYDSVLRGPVLPRSGKSGHHGAGLRPHPHRPGHRV